MRTTHTFAILDVSQSTFDDVLARIRSAYESHPPSADHYINHTCGETGQPLIVLGEVALRAEKQTAAVLPSRGAVVTSELIQTLEAEEGADYYGEQLPKYARVGQGGSVLRLVSGNSYFRDAGQWHLSARMCQGSLCFFGTGRMKHIQRIEVVEATGQEWRDDNAGYLPEDKHNAGKGERYPRGWHPDRDY